jgi:hypothetical protein
MNHSPSASSAGEEEIGHPNAEKMTEEEQNNAHRGTNGDADREGKNQDEEINSEQRESPSFLTKMWKKIDLDLPTALMMMK